MNLLCERCSFACSRFHALLTEEAGTGEARAPMFLHVLVCLLHFSHSVKERWVTTLITKRLRRRLPPHRIAVPRWPIVVFHLSVFCLVFEQNSSCMAWLLSTTVVQEAERVCSPK